MPEKLQPINPGQKLQKRTENHGILVPGGATFYIPMPEKLRPENPSTDTAEKSRPVKTDTAGKSCGQ